MTPKERKPFAAAMTKLFSIWGDELTPSVLDTWWGALEPYPLEQVMAAMSEHATDPERGTYKPLPADLIRHLTITFPKRAAEARAALHTARYNQLRPIETRIYLAENDLSLGLITESECFARKEQCRREIQGIMALPQFSELKYLKHDD